MLVDYALTLGTGLVGGVCLLSLLQRFSRQSGMLAHKGMPLTGGIGIGFSFLLVYCVGALLFKLPIQPAKGIIIAAYAMLAFGIVDDLVELSVPAKFLVQIVATSFLIVFGVKTQIVYIGPVANMAITYLWVLGITNAFNHLDVIDGLAAATSAVVSLAFFVICVLNGNLDIGILVLSLAIASASFLLYNYPPARMYMGNAGSHFLGFLLSAIALSISYAPMERKVALATPLVILGLPIFDTAFLIVIRILKKNSPFNKSNDHPALRLLAAGFTKHKALLCMCTLCLAYALCGIAVSQVSNAAGSTILAVVMAVSMALALAVGRIQVS